MKERKKYGRYLCIRIPRYSGHQRDSIVQVFFNAEVKKQDKAHGEVASILTYNVENRLGCAIGFAYYSVRKDHMFIREFHARRGFADAIFLPLPSAGKPALVAELKYGRTADTAIQQIMDRKC